MYTIRFSDPECNSERVADVGGKNAELGELLAAGIPVPPGFAVTTAFYRDFIESTGVADAIERASAQHDLRDAESAAAASAAIQSAFAVASLPADLKSALRGAWEAFVGDVEADPAVAVRSSATAEDQPEASYAGQQETYLNVRGFESVRDRVLDCMASLYSPRSISYRAEQGAAADPVEMSVGVQQLVDARSAGVMFTVNPANGDRSTARVEANWGLGVSVVSGSVTPDSFLVEKPTFEILEREVDRKETAVVMGADGTVERSVAPDRRDAPAISDEELEALVAVGKDIERHYGAPQDIEWAIDRSGEIYILQSRPETTWSDREQPTLSGGESSTGLLDGLSFGPDESDG